MPWTDLGEDEAPPVAGIDGFPSETEKRTPVDKVFELYRRMQQFGAEQFREPQRLRGHQRPQIGNGFRLENLLAEMRTRLRMEAAKKARLHAECILASAVPSEVLAQELAMLAPERCLVENGEFAVYRFESDECPQVLRELGRLRELTFREAGEGTGANQDIDTFDRYYEHVVLWQSARQEVVGAYRVGRTAKILNLYGAAGLYTNTLFRYDPQLFQKLGPAFELGRSFVRPEYQRQYAPLLLLWKGIGRLVAAHPETPVLFGAVSISNEYSAASRDLIYRFFETRMRRDELAGMVQPRRPFRPALLRRWDWRAPGLAKQALQDIDDLSQTIADVEPDGKGLPILVRQYAKIGGRMLAFNVDRQFSNVLDGLVVVDLRRAERGILEKYMGREGATGFRQQHSLEFSQV